MLTFKAFLCLIYAMIALASSFDFIYRLLSLLCIAALTLHDWTHIMCMSVCVCAVVFSQIQTTSTRPVFTIARNLVCHSNYSALFSLVCCNTGFCLFLSCTHTNTYTYTPASTQHANCQDYKLQAFLFYLLSLSKLCIRLLFFPSIYWMKHFAFHFVCYKCCCYCYMNKRCQYTICFHFVAHIACYISLAYIKQHTEKQKQTQSNIHIQIMQTHNLTNNATVLDKLHNDEPKTNRHATTWH